MAIENSNTSNKEFKDFKEELEELQEWQENQYNPGHYIGTGHIPANVKVIAKRPLLKIVLFFIYVVPLLVLVFVTGITWIKIGVMLLIAVLIWAVAWDSKRFINRR